MNENPVTLAVGMVQSVEPAIYRNGKYGIRTENLVAVVPSRFDNYLCFETLTLSPIDTKAVDISMMERHHIQWLNDYHQTVYQKLSPHLTPREQEWISLKTSPLL